MPILRQPGVDRPLTLMSVNEQHDFLRDYRAKCLRAAEARIGESMTQGRGDQAVVRKFLDFPKAMAKWQSLPIIQFVRGEYMMETWNEEKQSRSDEWSTVCGDAMQNLYWNDCIFYWVDLPYKKRYWARIRPALDFFNDDPVDDAVMALRRQAGAPVWFDKNTKQPSSVSEREYAQTELFHAVYFWEEDDGVVISEGFIKRKDPINQNWEQADRQDPTGNASGACVAVCTLYAYLAQTAERTVEVTNAAPRSPKDSKTGKKKPWLRDDVPYIVMLDPTRAETVGWRPRVAPGEAHRKSPKPHDRRGHRRTYRAIPGVREEKTIWVRPAWIGPTDWEHQGRIYKVVRDRKFDEGSEGT
jgi:hypothetical protein